MIEKIKHIKFDHNRSNPRGRQMEQLSLTSKTDYDGVLRINIPTKLKAEQVDVFIVFDKSIKTSKSEKSDWPDNFFSETYGCLSDDPIERPLQGDYPVREELL